MQLFCMKCLALGAILSCLVAFAAIGAERGTEDDVWRRVDTASRTLQVMAGKQSVESFDRIAIGRGGASFDKARGDGNTPLGEYRIGWINQNNRYHRFFGFTYPNLQIAHRAFARGLITGDTLQEIITAHLEESIPPQSTRLGGQIGIHGLGGANPEVHELFDGTHGCVALTNRQVDRLAHWIKKGTLVQIR